MKPRPIEKRKDIAALAESSGLAVAVVDEESRQVETANNNSMCRVLNPGEKFSPECSQYCGKAFEAVTASGKPVEYECFAGLYCKAVPFEKDDKSLVAIAGRSFVKSENYRKATERAISGDWSRFRPTEFFENILMTGSVQPVAELAENLQTLAAAEPENLLEIGLPVKAPPQAPAPIIKSEPAESENVLSRMIRQFNDRSQSSAAAVAPAPVVAPAPTPPPQRRSEAEISEALAVRSLFGSMAKAEYRPACGKLLDFIANRFAVDSLLWFEIKEHRFRRILARGSIVEKAVEVGISADHPLFVRAAAQQMPLILRERVRPGSDERRVLNLFAVSVGGEIKGALGVVGAIAAEDERRAIARIAQSVASQLEILRLRDEVTRRDWLARAVRRFNESLKTVDAEDFWLRLTQVSAELLRAERASLLVRSEKSSRLVVRAAVGAHVDLAAEPNLGVRVARPALESGEPVVVTGAGGSAALAPGEWRYKSDSFIVFPVTIGDRKLAVMNFTDRAGGEAFGDSDIELLQAIEPQIAMALDRATLKDKAGEFEQLSVTDALTGLLNRRYLQERLSEEIQRSRRHRSHMSFLMLDVDKFKSYNDAYGHPAGDEALRVVASILKENLRGDDVAARYGGEEFAILLPQTSIDEATVIAERIRKHVERTDFPKRGVTVSIGIAPATVHMHLPDDVIWAADRALYEAKSRGRNNVQIFNDFDDANGEKIH